MKGPFLALGPGQRVSAGPAPGRREVVDRLDSDGEPNEIAGNLQRRTGRARVGHPARVLDQRLHAAQRLPQHEQLGPVADRHRSLLTTGRAEAHHAPEAPHLLGRDLVAGVLRQPGIEHLSHLRVAGQELDHPLGVVAVPVHPYPEGLDSPQSEPGIERPVDRAHRVLVVAPALAQLRRRSSPGRHRPRRSVRRRTSWWSGPPRRRRARAAAAGTARRTCCPPPAARRGRARWRPAPAMSAMPSSGFVGVSTQTIRVRVVHRPPGPRPRRTLGRGPLQAPALRRPGRRAGTCRRTRRPGSPRGHRACRPYAAGCPRPPGRWRTPARAGRPPARPGTPAARRGSGCRPRLYS